MDVVDAVLPWTVEPIPLCGPSNQTNEAISHVDSIGRIPFRLHKATRPTARLHKANGQAAGGSVI